MNDPVKQDQINKAVWRACDTFRGTVDSSIYKDYLLTMLFVKHLSVVRRNDSLKGGGITQVRTST